MELTLNINGKNKKFKTSNPTFRIMRLASELLAMEEKGEFFSTNADNDSLSKDLDTLLDFVVVAFGEQFTAEEFETGYTAEDAVEFYLFGKSLLNEVMINPKRETNMSKMMTELEKTKEQVEKALSKQY